MESRRLFSIIVPVYQNEPNLDQTIPRLLSLQEVLKGYRIELVLVDDGSHDRSLAILKEWKARFPENLSVIKLTRNFGQNPAILAGLRHAKGDCVGIISADLQEPHETFVEMIQHWERGSRYVIGVRKARRDGFNPFNWLYWRMLNWFFSSKFPNQGYDFCLLDRSVLQQLNQINERNTSVFTLLFWLGYEPTQVPIVRMKRIHGVSRNYFKKRVRIALDTFIGFTHLPVRVLTLASFFLGLSAMSYLTFLLGRYFFIGAGPEGWMTIVGLLLIIGAFVLMGLGIAGEYLWRILDEVRRRPSYIIEENLPAEKASGELKAPASITFSSESLITPDL